MIDYYLLAKDADGHQFFSVKRVDLAAAFLMGTGLLLFNLEYMRRQIVELAGTSDLTWTGYAGVD